jgi:hypothetical protein
MILLLKNCPILRYIDFTQAWTLLGISPEIHNHGPGNGDQKLLANDARPQGQGGHAKHPSHPLRRVARPAAASQGTGAEDFLRVPVTSSAEAYWSFGRGSQSFRSTRQLCPGVNPAQRLRLKVSLVAIDRVVRRSSAVPVVLWRVDRVPDGRFEA